jgi:hypothetical protein
MAGYIGSRKDYRRKAPRLPDPQGPDRTGELLFWLTVFLAVAVSLAWVLAR